MNTRPKRKRRHRTRKRKQQASTQSGIDWQQPFPALEPEDRLSAITDYRKIIPGYDEFVAEVGKEALEEEMDYFFFFLGNSTCLADEPEFQDVQLGIDPHDFLVYDLAVFIRQQFDESETPNIFAADGGYVEPYEHILQHAIERYLTRSLRFDLRRRAKRVARRRRNTGIGSMADAVRVALSDEGIPPLIITLLQKLFSNALIDGVLNLEERFDQDWEERDRSLDTWMEQVAGADFDQPAEEAVEKLVAAEKRALPHIGHLFYEMDFDYSTYPVLTAMEIAARIPCQFALRILLDALYNDGNWESERAVELLSNLPDLVCPYLSYALTVPDGPDWSTALWGYAVLGKTKCPHAFDMLVTGLLYKAKEPYSAEGIQLTAAEGLLEQGDERAIPILCDYLHNPQADLEARSELLYILLKHEGGHPWGKQIAGELADPDELPK